MIYWIYTSILISVLVGLTPSSQHAAHKPGFQPLPTITCITPTKNSMHVTFRLAMQLGIVGSRVEGKGKVFDDSGQYCMHS